jgi:DNA-binding transcriptional regulator YbjK
MGGTRTEAIADAAIAVLAERGTRGLTHRAVDEAAGLPAGSASNVARSRAALLETALTRLADLEGTTYPAHPSAGPPPADEPAESAEAALVDAVTHGVHRAVTAGRALTLARFELALEATRRPELRALYDRLGRDFHLTAADLLARAGSRSPAADAYWLISACDGILFHAVAGPGHDRALTAEELRRRIHSLVAALLTP